MFKSIAVRVAQGTQYIKDPRKANPAGFRGKPVISAAACEEGCTACVASCPTGAITLTAMTEMPSPPTPLPQAGEGSEVSRYATSTLDTVKIDLGRCVMCGDCEPACPSAKLSFINDFRLASTERTGLVVSESRPHIDPIKVSSALRRRFGRSLKLRVVSAGGCNGCELEINALSNVNFDFGRYGIDIVASPRHADGLVLSGVLNQNMAQSLQLCWDGIPDPKFVIAVGACAISGSPFEGAAGIERSFLERFTPSLYIPGCPPHPLTFICGVLDLLGIPS
ncbi:MAG: 4Fe-4S dicluster domain-containing protein [Glaciimonas sp.]|nr:4Fe-4S dicluster domain-containing protein [Glaciimonas sp.]